ncbi:MAG: SCO family protein [Acidobacteriia bacterium]|nr:SCO family protein [Terriglobia bacterium]
MLRRNSIIGTVVVIAMAMWGAVLPAAALDNSRWGANYFPNVELITQDGNTVHFYNDLIRGKMVVIDLIYTHCVDACPLETARLAQVQRMLGDRVGKDIFFYSITIDPKRDTPQVLKEYAEKYHAGPGWLFLTGKTADIELISKKLGLYSNPNSSRDGHTPAVLLGNEATGQWMRNSATDNPRFLAIMIGDWLNSWKNAKPQTAETNYAQATPLVIQDQGQYIFSTHCAACHSIGQGDKIGPDLLGVATLRERGWLMRFIQTPDKMLAENDPIAVELFARYKQVNMPNLRLGESESAVLIKFIAARTAEIQQERPASGKPSTNKTEPAVSNQ